MNGVDVDKEDGIGIPSNNAGVYCIVACIGNVSVARGALVEDVLANRIRNAVGIFVAVSA